MTAGADSRNDLTRIVRQTIYATLIISSGKTILSIGKYQVFDKKNRKSAGPVGPAFGTRTVNENARCKCDGGLTSHGGRRGMPTSSVTKIITIKRNRLLKKKKQTS